MDNFVIVGPSAGSYQRQKRYCETRWRGWTEANEGWPQLLELVVQVYLSNSGMYGDKPMSDWETNQGIGKFTYVVATPVRIAYSSTSDGSKLFGWSAY